MNLLNLSRIALKAMISNKMRTFLTMLGMIIGVASVIAMLAIGQGSKLSIEEQVSDMGTNLIFIRPESESHGGVRLESGVMETLSLEDIEAIERDAPSVMAVSPQVSGRGQAINGSKNWPTSIQGVSPEYLPIRALEVADGTVFTQRDIRTAAKVCMLGETVVKNLFKEGESPIGQTVRFNNIPFKVVGILGEKGESTFGQDQDDIILAPYTTVQKRILGITHVQTIFASAISEDQTDRAVEEISEALRRSHKLDPRVGDDFIIRTQSDLLQTFGSISKMLTVLLAAIAGISLLVGGIGIMNIMLVSVTERTREIGLRMAIGGQESDILMQFLIESVMISIGGGLIGIILGLGASSIVGSALGWPIMVTSYSIIISFAVCAVIGMFFGWYPARKASYLNPIDALRYE